MLKPDALATNWYVYEDGTHRRHNTNDRESWPLTIEPAAVIALWKLHTASPLVACNVNYVGVVTRNTATKPGLVLEVRTDTDGHIRLRTGANTEGFVLWRQEDAHS